MSRLAVGSYWMHDLGANRPTRAPLEGDHDCDVVIVGGGYTGLWAAHYLTRQAPGTRVTVLEADHVGAGASGRNGGWLSHLVPGNRTLYAREAGHDAVTRLQRLMVDAVDEVLDEAARLRIDMDAVRGGNLVVATTPAGLHRLREQRAADRAFGLTDEECVELSPAQVGARIDVHGAVGGLFCPTVARIHPGKLVTGLADAVERAGVTVCEQSRATGVRPGEVVTARGRVRAAHVLVCTEGYGGPLLGARRLIPVNSSMIVTRPLDDAAWEAIGWQGRECLSDAAHTFVYAQRTVDGRIAIGGRGSPYRFGSGTNPAGDTAGRTTAALVRRLHDLFPGVELEAERTWSGVLGVTRDWCATVHHDPGGFGAAFGYAGHGVTSANLAARTLVDLTLGRSTELTRSPLVGRRSPSWEPEPLRWLGVHSMYRLFAAADAWERRSGHRRTSLIARVGAKLAGLDGH